MELIQRYQMARDSSSASGFNNFNNSWVTQNKNLLKTIAGVVVAIVVFVGGFFAGHSFLPNNSAAESVVPTYESALPAPEIPNPAVISSPRKAPPPISWDGVCPRKAEKCPRNFQGTPPLILVSLDGFHPDYLKRGFTPTISKLAQCGTSADFLYPVFPSKTFPNHYSIVTGLYPASHGIIDNSMYDPFRRKLFKVGSPEMSEPYWYQKDPIWVTAERQGKKSASFFWPGSDVRINNTLPTYYRRYSSKLSFVVRVDQVLAWLELPPASRPSFITLYVNQPDHAGHWSGVESRQVDQALANADQMITRLFAGLQLRNLTDCVNVIILSDHGMSDIDCKLLVDIQKYMDVSEVYATMGPFGRLRPKGKRDASKIAEVVSKLSCKNEHMRVYPKEQLPVRMHFADNARIEPIFLDLDSGWTVVSKTAKAGDEICTGGAHGYDNLYSDMRALFLAYGPSIKKNNSIKPFINTELYELLTELTGIIPNPNNGTRGSLHHILKSPSALPPHSEPEPPAVGYVPEDVEDYNNRVKASNCSCSQSSKEVDVENKMEKRKQHLPFGVPYSPSDNSTLRLLYNEDYILSFDLKYRIPMWTAFTLDKKRNASESKDVCWTGDARIPASDAPKCGDYSLPLAQKQYIQQRPLYPPEFSDSSLKEQAAYVTNAIPKSMNYTLIIEKKLNQILDKWTQQSSQLNVVMGSAFDLLATGVKPDIGKIIRTRVTFGSLVVPTHIFVIATWCSEAVDTVKECDSSKLVAHGFLLPNTPFTQNCEVGEIIIVKNVARIVDIEKLTGLSFYTGLPTYDAIRLRTMMPQRSVL